MIQQAALYAHGALLVVRFARDGIERALRHLVGVALDKVKRQEDLARRDDFGNAQFHSAHTTARRNHFNAIVGFQVQISRIAWIHLEPGARRHPLQDRDPPVLVRVCQCSTVRPVLSTRGIRRSAARETAPTPWASGARAHRRSGNLRLRRAARTGRVRCACRKRPLNRHRSVRVRSMSCRSSRRAAPPTRAAILRMHPRACSSRETIPRDSQVVRRRPERCRSRFALRPAVPLRIHLAHAAFGVGVGAFLLAPDRRRQHQVGQFGRRRRMEAILHDQKFEVPQRLLQHVDIGKRDQRVRGDDPERANLSGDGGFDDVGIRQAALRGNALGVRCSTYGPARRGAPRIRICDSRAGPMRSPPRACPWRCTGR